MNQRLEGWKLALAVLVPAAIVAVAIWFALQALSGDDGTSIDSSQQDDALLTPTPTEPPETNELDEPTVVPTPTPLDLPDAPAGPRATATPAADATPTPTPTRTPSSQPPGPRPTATPTVDPNDVTITCTGVTFPVSLDEGGTLAPLAAAVSPPGRAAGLRFLWNFGNGRTAAAPNTGIVTYATAGSYAVTVQATDTASGQVFNVTCGTVNVGGTTGGTITVSCQVRPAATGLPWQNATTNDPMRVTTTWRPSDAILTLQYEFGLLDPITIKNDASSGDNLTRVFGSLDDTVKIFWRNEDTGASGRISCPAFPSQTNPTPTTYAGAVAP